nr:MAG TPA: hypothetical protein [Caudoviricetes sp.]
MALHYIMLVIYFFLLIFYYNIDFLFCQILSNGNFYFVDCLGN